MKKLLLLSFGLLATALTTNANSTSWFHSKAQEIDHCTLSIGFRKSDQTDPVLWKALMFYAIEKKSSSSSPKEVFEGFLYLMNLFSDCTGKPFHISGFINIESSEAVSRPYIKLEGGEDHEVNTITYSYTVQRKNYTNEHWQAMAEVLAHASKKNNFGPFAELVGMVFANQ